MPESQREIAVRTPDGVVLSAQEAGSGTPIVLLHGLTATRRYVVMGSRLLERSGHRVIAYDARGHGRSAPAPSADAYTYDLLAADLLAVLDALDIEHAVLAGASMGAQTALRLTLEHPERVAALGLITPAFDPERHGEDGGQGEDGAFLQWDRLARGLREGGVEGFVAAYDLDGVPERWRETVATVLRQRLAAHEHPLAVADALQAVPRSRPLESWGDLAAISVPTLVVGSRDQADPEHPLATAERYTAEITGARLIVEDEGPPARSPIAWQGGQLSKALAELAGS